jgi:hypothetical protein
VIRSWVRVGRSRLLPLAVVAFLLFLPQAAHAAPGWLSPVIISNPNPPGGNAFDPDVDVDSTGKATAVWIRDDGTSNRIQAATRQPGALSFGTAQTISSAGENSDEPHIAVNDNNGEAVAIWTRSETVSGAGDSVIKVAYRAPGGATFGSAQTISSTGAFHPQIAIDEQRNAHAIWERVVSGKTVIEAASQPPGGAFGAVETLSEGTFTSDRPELTAEPNGNATAVWTRFDGTSVIQTSARRELVFSRPGTGSPLRVPLVPEYKKCTSGNRTHTSPLVFPSCDPPVQDSSILTMGTAGAGGGFARLDIFCNGGAPGELAPCSTTAGDQEDVNISASVTDVRCVTGGTASCVLAGDDYTGQVIFTSNLRLTDLSNGIFADDPGTVQDFEFSFPTTCALNPLTTVGASCNVTTTMDALVPNLVKEKKRMVVSVLSFLVEDAGADGTITPVTGSCPPTCGSGDEKIYMRQGVFVP